MTTIAANPVDPMHTAVEAEPVDHPVRRALRSGRVVVGGTILGAILLLCLVTLPWTLDGPRPRDNHPAGPLYYDLQENTLTREPPHVWDLPEKLPAEKKAAANRLVYAFGTDTLGRSVLSRCLLGGTISLAVGLAAATISVVLGVTVGLVAGYRGGWIDTALMRFVDILYGLPYILLVILFKIAFEPLLARFLSTAAANLVVLFSAIGLVSWLTMSRVVRGQVLSIRAQPFIEACRAMGLSESRIFLKHILPNLIGPIIVYATLTVPGAILQESFLSFLGVGIQAPMPTWGSLAAEGLLNALNPLNSRWWLLVFPCALLAITLLSLNFVGDGLRDVFDPKRDAAKI